MTTQSMLCREKSLFVVYSKRGCTEQSVVYGDLLTVEMIVSQRC